MFQLIFIDFYSNLLNTVNNYNIENRRIKKKRRKNNFSKQNTGCKFFIFCFCFCFSNVDIKYENQ